ncbi:MAG: CBS domain-containing protein [Glycocaulis sp.]
MKVKDAMHRSVNWKTPDTKLADIARLMKQEDIGAVPVGENDRLVGMVTDRDMVVRGLTDGADLTRMTARDVMTKGIVYCMEDDPVDKAARLMSEKQIRRLPVLNSKKRMVGMLSLGDTSAAAPRDVVCEVVQSVASHH